MKSEQRRFKSWLNRVLKVLLLFFEFLVKELFFEFCILLGALLWVFTMYIIFRYCDIWHRSITFFNSHWNTICGGNNCSEFTKNSMSKRNSRSIVYDGRSRLVPQSVITVYLFGLKISIFWLKIFSVHVVSILSLIISILGVFYIENLVLYHIPLVLFFQKFEESTTVISIILGFDYYYFENLLK